MHACVCTNVSMQSKCRELESIREMEGRWVNGREGGREGGWVGGWVGVWVRGRARQPVTMNNDAAAQILQNRTLQQTARKCLLAL